MCFSKKEFIPIVSLFAWRETKQGNMAETTILIFFSDRNKQVDEAVEALH